MSNNHRFLPLTVLGILGAISAPSPAQPLPYPTATITQYMNRCIKTQGLPRRFCECRIHELQKRIGYRDFQRHAPTHRQGLQTAPPTAFADATAACIRSLSQPGKAAQKTDAGLLPYPPMVVQAFVQGCERNKQAPPAFCQCSITRIQQRVPLRDFLEWASHPRTTIVAAAPPELLKSVLACGLQHIPSQAPQASPHKNGQVSSI